MHCERLLSTFLLFRVPLPCTYVSHSFPAPLSLFPPPLPLLFCCRCSFQEVEADEALVRSAGQYLVEVALPSAAAAVKGVEDQPMDGKTLSDTLHAHGVNLRYLGKVRLAGKRSRDLRHFFIPYLEAS